MIATPRACCCSTAPRGAWDDRNFRELPDLLRGDELIVVNNTRVLPARLFGRRAGIHAEPPGEIIPRAPRIPPGSDRSSAGPPDWSPTPGRRWFGREEKSLSASELFSAKANSRHGRGARRLWPARAAIHSRDGFRETLTHLGHIPLPPYIKREDEPLDRERYQTVFARQGSAVAAPTAGLHFTPEILERLRKRGIEIAEITLDVGLGTFEPVRTERLEDHKIHAEAYEIPEATCRRDRASAEREPRPCWLWGLRS